MVCCLCLQSGSSSLIALHGDDRHQAHSRCLIQWLNFSGGWKRSTFTCPLCKAPVSMELLEASDHVKERMIENVLNGNLRRLTALLQDLSYEPAFLITLTKTALTQSERSYLMISELLPKCSFSFKQINDEFKLDVLLVMALLRSGVASGHDAQFWAASTGSADMLHILNELGISFNKLNEAHCHGVQAIRLAVLNNQLEFIKAMFDIWPDTRSHDTDALYFSMIMEDRELTMGCLDISTRPLYCCQYMLSKWFVQIRPEWNHFYSRKCLNYTKTLDEDTMTCKYCKFPVM